MLLPRLPPVSRSRTGVLFFCDGLLRLYQHVARRAPNNPYAAAIATAYYMGFEPGRAATPYTKVTRDQFEVLHNEIRHKPTGASFTSYPGRDKDISHVNWSRCGDVLPNGEDYSRDDVGKIAAMLMAEQEITK